MTASAAVANAGFGAVVLLSMLVLQDIQGLTAIEAGVAFLPFSFGIAVAAILSGRLEGRPPWAVMVVALSLGAAGTLGMGLADPFAFYLVLSAPAGFGIGLTFSYSGTSLPFHQITHIV